MALDNTLDTLKSLRSLSSIFDPLRSITPRSFSSALTIVRWTWTRWLESLVLRRSNFQERMFKGLWVSMTRYRYDYS